MDTNQSRPDTSAPGRNENGGRDVRSIKAEVHRRLLETLDLGEARRMPLEELHRECSRRADQLLSEQKMPLSGPEKSQLLHEVMDDVFGLGPLEEFLRDPSVSDILVNGSQQMYVERYGVLEPAYATFRDDEHLIQVIQRMADRVGRRIDEGYPMLDARLADGSRVNAIIPPLAIDGPALSIRRFGTMPIDRQKLLEFGTWVNEVAMFLEACVHCRMNILISGGTGTGKTTLLNVLSKWIPPGERVVSIEDTAELQLQRDHVIRLETRPPNIEGKGEVTQRPVEKHPPDEAGPNHHWRGQGAEALDMLQAMNTGHEGSMTTVHANSPRDALRRIENMVSMAGLNYAVRVIREQTESALDVLVHLARVTGGRRKIVQVSEVTGMEVETICLHDLFRWRQVGIGPDGHAQGKFEACGVRPRLYERLQAEGFDLPGDMFRHRVLEEPETVTEGREIV